jgi:hypothetical protein
MDLPNLDLQSLSALQSAGNMPTGFAGFLGSMVEHINSGAAWVAAQPTAPYVAAGTAVALGMVLWLAGAKVLKPALALLGTLWGAAAGAMLFPMLTAPGSPTPGDIDPAWIGLGCGAVLGLLATLMAFRTAIALSLGAVCAMLAFVATAGMLGVAQLSTNSADRSDARSDSPRIWIVAHGASSQSSLGSFVRNGHEIATDEPTSVLGFTGPAARVEAQVRSMANGASETWATLPRGTQLTMLFGAVGGALAGMILGLTATRSATALLTASTGSAAWLIGGAWLVQAVAPNALERFGVQPIGWLVIWLTLAAAGVFMQRQRAKASTLVQAVAPAPAPQLRPL